MAMPWTYVNASENPRSTVTLSPCPTMIPERIGIIGSTHGVNDSNKPPAKNAPSISNRLPLRTRLARRSCSETNALPPLVPGDAPDDGVAPATFAAAPPEGAPPEEAVPDATPLPVGSFTFSVLVIGG